MKRPDILSNAHRCVCGEREDDYGTPENNFGLIGKLWTLYLKAAHPDLQSVMPNDGISALDVSMMMSLLKVARIATGRPKADNFIDLAGYAACGGEIATEVLDTVCRNPEAIPGGYSAGIGANARGV